MSVNLINNGNVQKVKANLITITSSANNLPSEYQEVEWIKSKDNAYINPNANITADIGFEVTANIPSGTNGTIIGNYLPGNYFFFVYSYTNNTTAFFPTKTASSISMTVARDTKTTFSFKNGVLDDGTTQTTVSTYATDETGQPIYLFSGRPNNWFTSFTLYRCKIYNGSTVVKDLIPCYRKADGEIGLYDLITENFYSNANSVGSFEKGDDVQGISVQKVKTNILSKTQNLLKLARTEWNNTSYQPTDLVTFDYNKLYYMASSGYIRPKDNSLNETITNSSVTFTQTSSSWWGIGFPFEVKPSTKYTIGVKRTNGTKTKVMYALYNADGSFASYAQLTTNTSILDISLTITTGANTKTMVIVVAGITQGDTIYAYDLQVEEGQTRTSFKPYGYEIIKI